jgi:predicted nucleic acid-binding protein
MDNILVVDNSVVMSWCFHDGNNSYPNAVLDHLTEAGALVPSIWPLEVVNVLLVAERRKFLKETDSVQFIRLLLQLPIRVEYQSAESVLKDVLWLARAQGLSSYDASYLDLAMKKNLPLATLDKRMMKAARSVDVKLFETI